MAQLGASMSVVVLGGVVQVMGSTFARGKIFTAPICSVDSLYPSVYILIQYTSVYILMQYTSYIGSFSMDGIYLGRK